MAGIKKRKKKAARVVGTEGIVSIQSTFNNTIISIADKGGNVVSWATGGKIGYKGSRKSTPYVAQLASAEAAKEAMAQGIRKVSVKVKGTGSGRESAIRALGAAGLEVTAIRDITPIPHNGCRPPKRRRV